MDIQPIVNLVLAGVSIAVLVFAMSKRNTQPASDAQLIAIVDRLSAELAGVKDELRDTQDELRNTQGELRNVQTYAARLAMQVIKLGGEPVRMVDVENVNTGTIHVLSRDTKRLLQIMREEFSIDELEIVAFEIGVQRGELGEGSIDSRALRLIEKAKNQNKLLDLAAIIWRERPDTARR